MLRPGYPAVFSPAPERTYRYVLWRLWNEQLRYLCIIGLNPSTADENTDDNTIRKCVKFAKRLGYGSLCMVNLFAYRARHPRDCFSAQDPIGSENDHWLQVCTQYAGMVIGAWGNDGERRGRANAVRRRVTEMHCFALNDTGQPAHPLYMLDSAVPFLLPALAQEVNLDDDV